MNLSVVDSSKYCIDTFIDMNSESEWCFTGFYGEPETFK